MEKTNLAYQKKVDITSFAPIDNSYASVEKGSKDNLTDGNFGDPSSCYGGGWAHFYRGVGRSLFIDLEDTYSVSGFDIGFIHDKNMGIYSPEKVDLYLSENGIDYYPITTVDSPYPASFGMQLRVSYAENFNKSYKARFVRIDFTVEVNVFCDEVRIFGNELNEEAMSLSGETHKDIFKNKYADREILNGIYDIPLLYFGYWPENERIARLRKEDFIPYLAYIDRDGNPIDSMFDAVIMLMVQSRCPSGGSLGYHGAPSKLSDWEFIINELFTEGINLKALDCAVAELKKSIFPKDYKHKVYLTAPVPKISLEPYGDMNGDGIEEKLLTTDDCINAYCYCVDELTRRFNAECFENIVLEGWFWNNESASRASRDDEEYYATRCIEELEKRGYKSIFIPYFQAGGCEKTEKIGFTVATMQPGLSFQTVLQSNPQGAMEDFSKLCQKYGFGVELEIHHGAKNPETKEVYGKLFDEYMLGCLRNGMMRNTVHTYYQAAGPGVFYECAISKDDYIRSIYDKLYKFIKGTLTENDFGIEEPIEAIEETDENANEEILVEIIEEAIEEVIEESDDTVPELEENEGEELNTQLDKEDSIFEIEDGLNEIAIDQTIPTESDNFFEDDSISSIKKKKTQKSNFFKKHKKKIAIGASIAAAAGIVYIIAKAIKDKDR